MHCKFMVGYTVKSLFTCLMAETCAFYCSETFFNFLFFLQTANKLAELKAIKPNALDSIFKSWNCEYTKFKLHHEHFPGNTQSLY